MGGIVTQRGLGGGENENAKSWEEERSAGEWEEPARRGEVAMFSLLPIRNAGKFLAM